MVGAGILADGVVAVVVVAAVVAMVGVGGGAGGAGPSVSGATRDELCCSP